jgi:hypothetical protein
MAEDYGITYYLSAEDERYPILVLQGDFGSVGYSLDKETGVLRRICLCAAHNSSECVCGGMHLTDRGHFAMTHWMPLPPQPTGDL